MNMLRHEDNALPDTTLNTVVTAELISASIETPSTAQLYSQSTRSSSTTTSLRSTPSLENSIPLENQRQRLKEAGRVLWRPDGEPIADLNDLMACLMHAAKGSFRSATLAFTIRAWGNLLLVLLRLKRLPRERRFAVMRHAVFGEATWRFSLVLGTFTGLYKFLFNAFPILFHSIPRTRPSLSGTPSLENLTKTKGIQLRCDTQQGAEMQTLAKRPSWHAALAGAIAGGLAILWDKDAHVIAQQAFFKGLQGSYNSFAAKHDLHVPHGDVLLYSLALGQIMYAFFLRPDTLPPSYQTWIGKASKFAPEANQMNLDLVQRGTFNILDLDKICKEPDITPANLTHLEGMRASYLSSSASAIDPSLPRYAPCSAVHPNVTSCLCVLLDRFLFGFKFVLPAYSAIHFVPSFLFKRQAFRRDPKRLGLRAGLGSVRSSAFWGISVVVCYSVLCGKHNLHRLLTDLKRSSSAKSKSNPLVMIPQKVIDMLLSPTSYWMLGFVAGFSLFVEEKTRRAELVMYVLPKALESMWVMAREKGLVIGTGKWGSTLLATMGMSMLMVKFTAASVFFQIDKFLRPHTSTALVIYRE